MHRWLSICALALVSFFSIAGRTSAVIIPYGTFPGANVTFENVTEDTHSTPAALFGPPTVHGDMMDFDPPSFTAAAGPATPLSSTQGTLTFGVQSNSNSFGINQLEISEAGDFTLVGFAPASAQVTVTAQVQYRVTHVNGIALPVSCDGAGAMTFSPVGAGGNGVYQTPGDNGTAVPWQGHFSADIAALLTSCNLNGLATRVDVELDNTLLATASNGGSAFIAKKDFSGLAILVPEPAVVTSLFGLLVLLGRTGRRRRG